MPGCANRAGRVNRGLSWSSVILGRIPPRAGRCVHNTDLHEGDEMPLTADAAYAVLRRRRRVLSGLLRVAVGGAVIAVLLVRSDPGDIARAITNARFGYVAAAFGVMLAMLVVGAFRWHLFLRSLGMPLPAWTLLRLYFVG